jgi:hypothetical protein
MMIGAGVRCTCFSLCIVWVPAFVSAQAIESVGSRAQGMGGAFVAVANDSSATWWNPAGLAEGPFLDMALAHAVTSVADSVPSRREPTTSFALGTPPIGLSYYRFQITDIRRSSPTVGAAAGRQDSGGVVPVRSLSASQFGVTLLHSLTSGVHAGTTLKYVRGAAEGEDTEQDFDLDVGLLAVAGAIRLGAVAKNLREPTFGADEVALPRQVRIGAAFDAAASGGPPLTVAVDADVRTATFAWGDRRMVAVGAERWLLARRFGIRAGARFNTTGAEDRSATAGLTVSPRPGLYVDGHVVRGGSADDRGWGVAARVSF